MRKRNLIAVFFVLFFVAIMDCYADYSYIVVNDSINVRTGPSTAYESKTIVKNGANYKLLKDDIIPDEKMNGDCDSGWYNIDYDGTSAYVCSEFVTKYIAKETTPEEEEQAKNACESEMKNAGFPSSYWNDLCAIKKVRPTWQFKALNTNLDFATVVNKESSCGKSYIASSKADDIDTSCKNDYKSTWYPASKKAVAYYIDPRNWLDEKHIFQFLFLKYETGMASVYPGSVTNIIKSTEFYKYHNSVGNDLGKIIDTAGKDTDVSPVFLATRMRQELGTGDSLKNLYQGNYTGHNGVYKGYYNFFNYGVTDSCATTNGTSYCGLEYAKNHGWNSPAAAIKGASSNLSSSYISVGQYTVYLQKFNVVPSKLSSLYLHQYMTNVGGPSSEAVTTYNSYNKMNLLDTAFVFYIPVYNNLNNDINNSGSGATGDGGDTEASSYDVSTIVKLAGYQYDDKYLEHIELGTKVSDLKGAIEAISGTAIYVTDAKGNSLNIDDVIGTGTLVKISNRTTSETLEVVIKGDTSGDGKTNALDLLQVQKDILGSYTLKDVQLKAGDTSGDGKVNALDLLQIQKDILGVSKIKQ